MQETESLSPILLVGAPLRLDGKLFNCAAVIYRGQLLGNRSEKLFAQLPRVL